MMLVCSAKHYNHVAKLVAKVVLNRLRIPHASDIGPSSQLGLDLGGVLLVWSDVVGPGGRLRAHMWGCGSGVAVAVGWATGRSIAGTH